MIPISDYAGRRRRFPWVMLAILALNVLVFLYEMSLEPRALQGFVSSFGAIPYEIIHRVDLPPAGPQPIYLTLFTAMFIHAGFLHLASNMLYLWVFGDNVEDQMGHIRFLVFYLLAGLLASATHIALGPDSRLPSVGASGAIAGVLGAYLVLFPRAQVRVLLFLGPFITTTMVSSFLLIGFWALVQMFSGIGSLAVDTEQTGGVAYWAHIGGFVAGLILVNFFRRR